LSIKVLSKVEAVMVEALLLFPAPVLGNPDKQAVPLFL
jgi:hypothetical protein